MVQNTRTSVVWRIFTRTLLLIGVIILAIFTSDPAHNFLLNTLGYRNPSGFFIASWADWELALALTFTFWGGVIFGALGKKIDYIFVFITILFALWEFIGTQNITPQMYLGLIGVAALGNALGYIAKLARQNWLTKQR